MLDKIKERMNQFCILTVRNEDGSTATYKAFILELLKEDQVVRFKLGMTRVVSAEVKNVIGVSDDSA